MPNLPTLKKRPPRRYWYYSWYGPNGRERASCGFLGLTTDVPHDIALKKVMYFLGLGPDPDKQPAETLGWFYQYLSDRGDRNIEDKTLKLYLSGFALFTKMLGSDFPLREVKRIPHVAQFQDWLSRSTNRNPVTINITCRSVQAVFSRAFDFGFVVNNPFYRFSRLREPDDQIQHMEDPELEQFLSVVHAWMPHKFSRYPAIKHEAVKRLVLILLYLGRRRSEVLAIRRDDIDVTNNTLRLYLRKKRKKWPVLVDIPLEIRDDLLWFLDHFQTDYPFCVFKPNSISRLIKRWLTEAKLPDSLHLHSIRHTALSLAANQPDANLRAIQRLTGHSTLAQVEHYVHGKSLGKITFGKNYNIHNRVEE